MTNKAVCFNCRFYMPAPGNQLYDGFCKIQMPPQYAKSSESSSIRFAHTQTCDLHTPAVPRSDL